MKTKWLFFILLLSTGLLTAQNDNSVTTDDYKLIVYNSFLQLFHPTSSVFAIGLEARMPEGLAVNLEYGLPLKSFGYTYENEGKNNWHYYKTRLGARYYFDPVKPYKFKHRYREPRLKRFKNFVGIEGMVGAETFDRENGSFYKDNTFISYSNAKVVILSRSLILVYGRQFNVSERFVSGFHIGLGQKYSNVSYESVLVDSSSGGFGFFGSFGNGDRQEGIRRVPYVKFGVELGFRTLKR